jgi:GxxExxY protein
MVEGKVILELKAGEGILIAEHELQLGNYLKATNTEVGLLLHF